MLLSRTHRPAGDPSRRGAALLLSFLVLLVILAIVFQINVVTNTDARVARNDVTLTTMDLAVESARLQVFESLKADAEGAAGGEGGAAPGGDLGGLPGDTGGAEGAPGGEGGGVDSRMDEWGRPQSTNIGELSLRILVQDEESKYNLLNMLAEDPDDAEDAFERVLRILDLCREGTTEDIEPAQADEMARAMRDHMLERSTSLLPRPQLLTDDEENTELGMPLTLREFVVLEPFEERHFRDYFDVDGQRVHSIGSFLTIYTSPAMGSGDAEGGNVVNINTAPLAVLAGLMDDRDVRTRFWDSVRDYRNEEEEPEGDEEEAEPVLDEFGQEVVRTKIFDDLGELEEVYDWGAMEPDIKAEVEALLAVESQVFSVFITARMPTSEEAGNVAEFNSRREQEEFERSGSHIVRTVRSVVWRRQDGDEVQIVPLLRWEVLDYAPLEVLDFPEDF